MIPLPAAMPSRGLGSRAVTVGLVGGWGRGKTVTAAPVHDMMI